MSHMIFCKEVDGQHRVQLIHHQPDQLSESRKAEGFEVESLPKRPDIDYETQRAVLLCDPETKELWYEVEGT